MIMLVLRRMVVLVFLFFRAFVRMQVCVLVRVLMRVRESVVPVLMRMQVHMRMRVLERNCVGDRKIRA